MWRKRNLKRGKCTTRADPSWSPVQVLSGPNCMCKNHGVIVNEMEMLKRNGRSHTLQKKDENSTRYFKCGFNYPFPNPG